MRKTFKIMALVLCMIAIVSCIAVFAASANDDSVSGEPTPQSLPTLTEEQLALYPAAEYPFLLYRDNVFEVGLKHWSVGNENQSAEVKDSVLGYIAASPKNSAYDIVLRKESATDGVVTLNTEIESEAFDNFIRFSKTAVINVDLNGLTLDTGGVKFLNLGLKRYGGTDLNFNVKNGTIRSTANILTINQAGTKTGWMADEINFSFTDVKFDIGESNKLVSVGNLSACVCNTALTEDGNYSDYSSWIKPSLGKLPINISFSGCTTADGTPRGNSVNSNTGDVVVTINCPHKDANSDYACDFCGEIIDPVNYYTNNGYAFLVYAKGEGESDYKVIGATKNFGSSTDSTSLAYFLKKKNETLKDSDVEVKLLTDYTNSGKSWFLAETCFKSFTLDLNGKIFSATGNNIYIELDNTNESFTKYGLNFTIKNGYIGGETNRFIRLQSSYTAMTGPKHVNLTFDGVDFTKMTATDYYIIKNYKPDADSSANTKIDCETINGKSNYEFNVTIKNIKSGLRATNALTNITNWGENISYKRVCEHKDSDGDKLCDSCGSIDESFYPAEEYPLAVYVDGVFQMAFNRWSDDAERDTLFGWLGVNLSGKDVVVKLRTSFEDTSVVDQNNNAQLQPKNITIDLQGNTLTLPSHFFNYTFKEASSSQKTNGLTFNVKNGTIVTRDEGAAVFRVYTQAPQKETTAAYAFGKFLTANFENVKFQGFSNVIEGTLTTVGDMTNAVSKNNYTLPEGVSEFIITVNFNNCCSLTDGTAFDEKAIDNNNGEGEGENKIKDISFAITCDHANKSDAFVCSLCSKDYKVFTEVSVTVYKEFAFNYYTELPASAKERFKLTVGGVEYTAKITEDGKYLFFTFDGIGPHQIGKDYEATLVFDGKECVTKTQSVEDYLHELYEIEREKENNEVILNLIYDVLSYGQESQKYLYGETTIKIPEGLTRTAAEIPEVSKTAANNGGDVKILSANILFGTQNKLIFKIQSKEKPTVISIKAGDKDAVSAEAVKDGDIWLVYTEAIAATEFGTVYTITVGEGADAPTASISVNAYAYGMKDDSKIGALAKALYNYGVSAAAYYDALNASPAA